MSYSVAIKSSLFVSLVAILISFYLNNVSDFIKSGTNINRQSSVLNGLLELEENNFVGTGAQKPRVAVGYGACHDVFVSAKELLKNDILKGTPEHFNEIKNDFQLFKSFAYYFKHGAAAERFMSDSELFKQWVSKASSLQNARWALGGNAPVMATRFHKEGCKVLLAAKMTNELKKSLSNDIEVTNGPDVKEDDVHLIMEYDTNDEWSSIKSPRANRYIIHNDANNPTVSSLEYFGEVLPKFQPDLLVVSGLQMMDNYPFSKGAREKRLQAIKNQMIAQGPNTRVHFEMASFVEEKLLKDLTSLIIPFSDSLGMNEQELNNLHNIYLYGNVKHVSDFNPRVAQVLDEMRDLYRLIHTNSEKIENSKKLTRIHVHTLAYQIIMTEENSNWQRPKAAAAKAALTANRHVCGNKNIDVQKSRLILDNSFALSTKPGSKRINMTDENPVTCWEEQLVLSSDRISKVNICIAPVLVCTEVKQTAGCGDNISSAGLVLQI